jgi:hypothetical protein
MTTTSIEPGLKGTLSPEEYTTKPIPSWGPTYPGMAAAYRNMDYVCVAFATDPDKAAALIPKELELINIRALGGRRIQAVVATMGGFDSSSPKASAGVFQPRVLRGRALSSAATKAK